MSRKNSMMGSSKYEFDPNGLERDVNRKQEGFERLYAEIKQLIIDNSIVYQKYYGGTMGRLSVHGYEMYGYYKGILSELENILDILEGCK